MAEESPVFIPRHLPWLMLPCTCNGFRYYNRFYSTFDDTVHHKDLHYNTYKNRCVGSSHGWLIMVEDESPSIFAVNPDLKNSSSTARIQLPNLLDFPDILGFNRYEYVYSSHMGIITQPSRDIMDTYLKKVVLSKDPTEEGCMAVAIYGECNRLAICRVGDEEWKFIVSHEDDDDYLIHNFLDVVFDHEGRSYYAVNYHGIVVRGDFESPVFDLVYEPPLGPVYSDGKYLVFDKGKLMLINRYIGWKEYCSDDEDGEEYYDNEEDYYASRDGFPYRTARFKISRLDEKAGKLDEVDNLENGVLFLGNNQSLYLSNVEFAGCEGDRVYFTDDTIMARTEPRIGGYDIGVFSLKDGRIEQIQFVQNEVDRQNNEVVGIWPPPIWVTRPSS